ncbi:MAG: 16S rRNA (guanine(966)-N(2))-methyltransferase RsmD [Anaerolineae bacterium]|nr:16S rRNA (guanine(966)-N(2))-methyltransferase RsmD [Anaerolineae bacterium]
MSARVIAGTAKGRRLKMVPGEATRPVMDRVKEALFNILGGAVPGCRFLDLFAGTGSVGIEALSRGAARAVFIENHAPALRTIRENLALTGLADRAQIINADVFAYLHRPPAESFEFIYIAPPQYKDLWSRTLLALDRRPGFLFPDGVAIAQIDPKEYSALELEALVLYDQRTYGRTMLCFYERPGE